MIKQLKHIIILQIALCVTIVLHIYYTFESASCTHTHPQTTNQLLLLFSVQLYVPLPKSFTAFLIFLYVMLQRCRITLAQAVDVHDGHKVVKLVVGGKRHGLPDGAFWHLAIPQQAEHTVAEVENEKTINVCLCIRVWCMFWRRLFGLSVGLIGFVNTLSMSPWHCLIWQWFHFMYCKIKDNWLTNFYHQS